MKFKEFLNKECLYWDFLKSSKEATENPAYYDGLIEGRNRVLDRLGEYAWKRFVPTKQSVKGVKDTIFEFGVDGAFKVYMDEATNMFTDNQNALPFFIIACDCLGKKEVKKRLTILQGKEQHG